jgi:hypothetical protein
VSGELRPARGYSWPPFEGGNQVGLKHGVYSHGLVIAERARELADEIRESMPHYEPADEGMVRQLADAEARLERAIAALSSVDEKTADPLAAYHEKTAPLGLVRLREEYHRLQRLVRSLRNDLALSPTARFRMRQDAASSTEAAARLDRYLDEKREARDA